MFLFTFLSFFAGATQVQFLACQHEDLTRPMAAMEKFQVFSDDEKLKSFLEGSDESLAAMALTTVFGQPSLVPMELVAESEDGKRIATSFNFAGQNFQLDGVLKLEAIESNVPFRYAVENQNGQFAANYPFTCTFHR